MESPEEPLISLGTPEADPAPEMILEVDPAPTHSLGYMDKEEEEGEPIIVVSDHGKVALNIVSNNLGNNLRNRKKASLFLLTF